MPGIIIHHHLSPEAVNEKRLADNFKLSHRERVDKAFRLMRLSKLFSTKKEFKKGIIIR
jgi:hypothetical protein